MMKNFQLWLCIFLAIVVGIALGDAGIVTRVGLRTPSPEPTPRTVVEYVEIGCQDCYCAEDAIESFTDTFWEIWREELAYDGYFVCDICMQSALETGAMPTVAPSPEPNPTPSPTPTPEPTSVTLPSGWSNTAILFLNADTGIYHTASDCDKDAEMCRADKLTGLGYAACDKCFGKRSITTPKPYTPRPTPRPTQRPQVAPKPTERAYLYITDYGEKYHVRGCGSLWNSCNGPYTLSQVIGWGYEPCQRCDP